MSVLGAVESFFGNYFGLHCLQRVEIDRPIAEYAVNRVINGEDRIFLIDFIVDNDGVWRIEAM